MTIITKKSVRGRKQQIADATAHPCVNLIRRLREEMGVSQDVAAAGIGVSRQMYSRYESVVKAPKVSVLGRIAKFYNIPIEQLCQPV